MLPYQLGLQDAGVVTPSLVHHSGYIGLIEQASTPVMIILEASYGSLFTANVSGGEPLLSEETFLFLMKTLITSVPGRASQSY